ncbi:MAG: rubrerythrin family protein [Desulfovibrio sp.]|nr:rubrerythrin family protein [Desulfovibrio sp.]MBI4957975.1 rubrerythrin family protein [Desulfovibrio sp.]
MSKSKENLQEAFAGESQANRKYLAFAKQADKEGLKQVAKLFRATAEAETVHAHTHLHVLKGVGSTVDNLKAAIEGETHEFKNMYPKMIEEAQAEGDKQAERSFRFANEVEKIHAALYEKALADPAGLKSTEYYICSVCGYTCEDHAPDKCPVCQAAAKAFYSVG